VSWFGRVHLDRSRIDASNVIAAHRLNPNAAYTEAAKLATFDTNRDRINAVADKIRASDRRDFHILEADDFP